MKASQNKITGEKMDVYEVGYLLMPTVPEDSLSAEVSWLHDIIAANNGEIISEEFPKMRTLTYTMEKILESKHQKFNNAYFGWIKFELPVANIKVITHEIEKRSTMLRNLVIKTVRENTLYGTKLAEAKKAEEAAVADEKAASAKEIDTLVIN